MVVPDRSLTFT